MSRNAAPQSAPALAVSPTDNKLYCVHRGSLGNNQLWWSMFDGSTARGSSLAVDGNGILHCVHRGKFKRWSTEGEHLWWRTFTDSDWTEDSKFNQGNMSADDPAVALFDGNLWCVHRGLSDNVHPAGDYDDQLYWAKFNGAQMNWDSDTKFSGDNRSADGPALVVMLFQE